MLVEMRSSYLSVSTTQVFIPSGVDLQTSADRQWPEFCPTR